MSIVPMHRSVNRLKSSDLTDSGWDAVGGTAVRCPMSQSCCCVVVAYMDRWCCCLDADEAVVVTRLER